MSITRRNAIAASAVSVQVPPGLFEIAHARFQHPFRPRRDEHVQCVVVARNVVVPERLVHLDVAISDVHAANSHQAAEPSRIAAAAFQPLTEEEILEATRLLASNPKTVAEPSGAVSTAAFLFHRDELPETKMNVAVISGGNIEPELLARIRSKAS